MKNYPEKRSLVIIGLIFLLLAGGIAVVGYLSYRNFEKQFRAQVQGQLTAIANLKETELLNWRNEIRFKPDAALTLRFPLAQTERPAVKAVLGQIGVMGYYGEPVLTNLRAIPGTPWFLVAEMDTTQLYALLQEWLWQTIIFWVRCCW
ncbi:MAG: hypothetical protein HC875_18045 [Anaerolineales bacterium]|nr:hypothetical protein [Anaerolineales bacterium]